jgi:hypothetical protein
MPDLYTLIIVHGGRRDTAPASKGVNEKTKALVGMEYKNQVLAY